MPPSAVHTSIVGANKGHIRTNASSCVCVRLFLSFIPVLTALKHSLAHRKTPHTARPSEVAFGERKKAKTMTAPSESDVCISSYFSAQWSEREWEKGSGDVDFLRHPRAKGKNKGGQQ